MTMMDIGQFPKTDPQDIQAKTLQIMLHGERWE